MAQQEAANRWWPRAKSPPSLIYLLLGLAVAILVLVEGLALWNLTSTIHADRLENHTYVVMDSTTHLLFDLAEMQSHERGFLITGREHYRDRYHQAYTNATQTLASLKNLSRNDQPLQHKLQHTDDLLQAQNTQFLQIMSERDHHLSSVSALPADQSSSCIHVLRQQLAGIYDDEANFLKLRAASKQDHTRRTVSALVLGATLSLLLLFTGIFLLRREMLQRRAAELALAGSHAELERTVTLRTAALQ